MFPAAGQLDLALATARAVLGTSELSLEDVELKRPVVIMDKRIFIGNEKKTVQALKEALE